MDADAIKMKKVLMFFMMALLATMSFTLVSCGDDEEETGGSSADSYNSKIIGTWSEIYSGEGEPQEDIYWNFLEGGRLLCLAIYRESNSSSLPEYDLDSGSWSISGTTLTVKFDNESYSTPYRIVNLTSTELILGYGSDSEQLYNYKKVDDSVIAPYLPK